METNHKELFDHAKEAQNNVVEEARIRYKERIPDKEFNEWYNEEFTEAENPPTVPYVPASHLMKGQRKLADRAIEKLKCLIEQGWVVKV